jgi:hypothetical protein
MREEVTFDGKTAALDFYLQQVEGVSNTSRHVELSVERVGSLRPLEEVPAGTENIYLYWFPPSATWVAFDYYWSFEGTGRGGDDNLSSPSRYAGIPLEMPEPAAEEVAEATGKGTLVMRTISVKQDPDTKTQQYRVN